MTALETVAAAGAAAQARLEETEEIQDPQTVHL